MDGQTGLLVITFFRAERSYSSLDESTRPLPRIDMASPYSPICTRAKGLDQWNVEEHTL